MPKRRGRPTLYHSFLIEDAVKHGVNAAVFLNHLRTYLAHHAANGAHIHEGEVWNYNTQRAFTELYPYWTRNQVRTIVDRLLKDGAIVAAPMEGGKTHNRTLWYTIPGFLASVANDEEPIGEKPPMDLGGKSPKVGCEITQTMVENHQCSTDTVDTSRNTLSRTRDGVPEKKNADARAETATGEFVARSAGVPLRFADHVEPIARLMASVHEHEWSGMLGRMHVVKASDVAVTLSYRSTTEAEYVSANYRDRIAEAFDVPVSAVEIVRRGRPPEEDAA